MVDMLRDYTILRELYHQPHREYPRSNAYILDLLLSTFWSHFIKQHWSQREPKSTYQLMAIIRGVRQYE